MIRDSEVHNSVLTLHDFTLYQVSKEKKSFNIKLKVVFANLCVFQYQQFLKAVSFLLATKCVAHCVPRPLF